MAWRQEGSEKVYTPGEIAARLKAELPHWYYEDGWICRKYKTSGWKAKGVSDKDFALARKIEEVIAWQPGKDPDSPREGTPDEPRLKYLKYDDRAPAASRTIAPAPSARHEAWGVHCRDARHRPFRVGSEAASLSRLPRCVLGRRDRGVREARPPGMRLLAVALQTDTDVGFPTNSCAPGNAPGCGICPPLRAIHVRRRAARVDAGAAAIESRKHSMSTPLRTAPPLSHSATHCCNAGTNCSLVRRQRHGSEHAMKQRHATAI